MRFSGNQKDKRIEGPILKEEDPRTAAYRRKVEEHAEQCSHPDPSSCSFSFQTHYNVAKALLAILSRYTSRLCGVFITDDVLVDLVAVFALWVYETKREGVSGGEYPRCCCTKTIHQIISEWKTGNVYREPYTKGRTLYALDESSQTSFLFRKDLSRGTSVFSPFPAPLV